MRIMSAGLPFVLISLGATLLSLITALRFSWNVWAQILLAVAATVTLILFWFFRDPDRDSSPVLLLYEGTRKQPVLSPADGRVTDITDIGDMRRIGIFLSIFDCHVQRTPAPAIVKSVERKPGKYLAAFNERASVENASSTLTLENPHMGLYRVRQITGLLARRIVTTAQINQPLKSGERLGMILLGSRVELEVPKNKVEILASLGDYVYAGRTALGSYHVEK